MTYKDKIKKTQEIWEEAVKKFGSKKIGIGFTGRKDSTVLVHIMLTLAKDKKWKEIPEMFFIDNGSHFTETLEHLKRLEKEWGIKVSRFKDQVSIKAFKKEKDELKKRQILWQSKIKMINKAIHDGGWLAMASSVRWDEGVARKDEIYFSKRVDHTRVHPMLHWRESDIWKYIKENKISYNPLYDQGYRSLEEKDFTKKSKGTERSGRDQVKEEAMAELRGMGYF